MSLEVLVADDSRLLRKLICDIVSLTENMKVVGEAENGVQALALYKALHPHVVLMDIVMPEMDGIESLKLILDYDPQAHVIIISSSGQEDLVMESIVAGARNFLFKPIDQEALLLAIQAAQAPGNSHGAAL